jgi:hypothetical protein
LEQAEQVQRVLVLGLVEAIVLHLEQHPQVAEVEQEELL